MNVKDQAVVVTGGGSGMGEAIGRLLAAQGARVTLLDLNAEKVAAVADEIGALGIACDVTREDAVAAALDQAEAAHGVARLAVNCAGIANAGRVVGRDGPHRLDLFMTVVNVNLVGTFNVLRLAAHRMSAAEELPTGERGLIVNLASVAAYEGQIGQCAYAASKGGIVGLTLPAARELARYGIRVVTLAPGLIETPMMAGFTDEVRQALIDTAVFPKRLGEASEVARLVLHVAENAYLNGETIRIDGAVRLAPR